MTITETKGSALDFACINGHALIHCCNAQGKMDTPVSSFNLTIVEYRA